MSFELSVLSGGALSSEATARELLKCNERTAEYGLVLSPAQAAALTEYRGTALKQSGRIELGESVLKKLILAFRDSPYLNQREYEQQLSELLDIFYAFKNETQDCLSDDDILDYMKRSFDGACQGSLELLAGRALEDLLDKLSGEQKFIPESEREEFGEDEY